MTIFQIIKSTFEFLEKDFDFKVINEETTDYFDLYTYFQIVSYKNKYVQIEIGYEDSVVGGNIALEIRKLENGTPVKYNHPAKAINLKELQRLIQEINNQQEKFFISNFDELANLLKPQIKYFTTQEWFDGKKIENIKIETRKPRYKIIKKIEKLTQDYLNSKGFKFLKSNDTISSFEYWAGPFITFSNGEKQLTIKDETDVRENYFYYHIYLTNEEMTSINKFDIEKIGDKIKEFVK